MPFSVSDVTLGARADWMLSSAKWGQWNLTDAEAALDRAEESEDACSRNDIVGGAGLCAVLSGGGLLAASASDFSLRFQANVISHDV